VGLQARALYDYQAGKFHIGMYLLLYDVRMRVCALYDYQAGKFHIGMYLLLYDVRMCVCALYDYQAGKFHIDMYLSLYDVRMWVCALYDYQAVLRSSFRSSLLYTFSCHSSTNYSSILPHFILPSISWSTSWSC
jgi:hypothetical protein